MPEIENPEAKDDRSGFFDSRRLPDAKGTWPRRSEFQSARLRDGITFEKARRASSSGARSSTVLNP